MPLLAGGLAGLMPMVIILILFLALMTWTTRRNMKKQQNARQEMESSMGEGSRVMLTSGIYGTLTHVGDKQAIVELAPGAEIVVLKQAISKVVDPSDEEFSFADEAAAAEPEEIAGSTQAGWDQAQQGDDAQAPAEQLAEQADEQADEVAAFGPDDERATKDKASE